MSFSYVPATLDDLDILTECERSSFHPDEAFSRKTIQGLILNAAKAPELFVLLRDNENNNLVGYICASLSNEKLMTKKAMHSHEPQGKTVCVHAVCVTPEYRGKGIARDFLNKWLAHIRKVVSESNTNGNKVYDLVVLISRPYLIDFYQSVGFKKIGQSEIVLGPDPWTDCSLAL